ncbi:MAG: hypothetical protein RJB39_725 [Candidatus Parcubacteria bacterium]|jgi:hypothetical protein
MLRQNRRHRHRCSNCGCIWEHDDSCYDNTEAHTCPTPGCGEEQYRKYNGMMPPSFSQSCLSPGQNGGGLEPKPLTIIQPKQAEAITDWPNQGCW